ncbi:MAG TPA: heavy metal-responsive transcriptional regulator [Candidatus Acidoferrales bacterium]|nr:heavy metal-responsive transcriptional regulator [Candidatus Acidoferrales bacterium]
MHIGEVAKRAGVTSDAIRFYERCGILAKPPRTDAGYRLYSPDNVAVVLFLRRAQTLGFSLPQIRELVSLRTSGRPCAPVRDRLRRKLEEVRTKIDELKHIEHDLQLALRRCERQLRGHLERCPLLDNSAQNKERKPR